MQRGIIESQRKQTPKFSLDFLNQTFEVDGSAANLSDVLDYTPATQGVTVVGSDGNIQPFSGSFRTEYDPITLAVRGVLIEPEKRNYVQDNTAGFYHYKLGNATGTDGDGGNSSDSFYQTQYFNSVAGGKSSINIGNFTNAPSGSDYTISVYVKNRANSQYFYLLLNEGQTITETRVLIDLNSGTVIDSTPATSHAKIEECHNGYYRVSVYFACLSGNTPTCTGYWGSVSNGIAEAPDVTGNDDSILLALPQLEVGGLTSPILTNGGEITRTQDTLEKSASTYFNFSVFPKGTYVFHLGVIPGSSLFSFYNSSIEIQNDNYAFSSGVSDNLYMTKQFGINNSREDLLGSDLTIDGYTEIILEFSYDGYRTSTRVNGQFIKTGTLPTQKDFDSITFNLALQEIGGVFVPGPQWVRKIEFYDFVKIPHQIKPSLSMDFLNEQYSNFTTDITFSDISNRFTEALGRWKADGTFQGNSETGADFSTTGFVDHDPRTNSALGLVMQKAGGNLVAYNTDFDTSVWTYNNCSLAPSGDMKFGPILGTSGDSCARTLTVTADSSSSSYGSHVVQTLSESNCTRQWFAKAGTARYMTFSTTYDVGTWDWQELTFKRSPYNDLRATPVGGGWYLFEYSYGGSGTQIRIGCCATLTATRQGGSQTAGETIEIALPCAFANETVSRIPTKQDVKLSFDGFYSTLSTVNDWVMNDVVNPDEGTFVVDLESYDSNITVLDIFFLNDNDLLYFKPNPSAAGFDLVRRDSANVDTVHGTVYGVLPGTHTFAMRYKGDLFDVVVDGETRLSTTITGLNFDNAYNWYIGAFYDNNPLTLNRDSFGRLRKVQYYPSAIPNSYLGWNPTSIFRETSNGLIYDISDVTTLYQDSDGAIAVRDSGDPVGFIVDVASKYRHNKELFPQSSFDDGDTSWTEENAPYLTFNQVINGELETEVGANFAGTASVYKSTPVVQDSWYKVRAKVRRESSNSLAQCGLTIYKEGHVGVIAAQTFIDYDGYVHAMFKAEYTGDYYIGIAVSGDTETVGDKYYLSELSVKEANGNHAIQSTTSKKATYKNYKSEHWLEFDGNDDEYDIPGSAETLRFLHEDNKNYQIHVNGYNSNSDSFNVILDSCGYTTSNHGVGFGFEDRSTQNPPRIRYDIMRDVAQDGLINLSSTANSAYYDKKMIYSVVGINSQYQLFANGSAVDIGTTSKEPYIGPAKYDYKFGAVNGSGSANYSGQIRGLIIVDSYKAAANDFTQTIGFLTNKGFY